MAVLKYTHPQISFVFLQLRVYDTRGIFVHNKLFMLNWAYELIFDFYIKILVVSIKTE